MSGGAVTAIIATIIAISFLLDWMLSRQEVDREKTKLISWWVYLQEFKVVERIRQMCRFFNQSFDLFYGPKWWSWRRLWTSAVTTIVILSFLTIAYSIWSLWGGAPPLSLIAVPFPFSELTPPERPTWKEIIRLWIFVTVLGVPNLIVDFLSLNKTRALLRYSETANAWALCGLFLLDVVATVALFLACYGLIFSGLDHIIEAMLDNEFPFPGLLIAAFAASLMFYGLLLCALLVKLLGLLRPRLIIVLEKLEASDHLFKAIGVFLSALVAVGKGVSEVVTAFSA